METNATITVARQDGEPQELEVQLKTAHTHEGKLMRVLVDESRWKFRTSDLVWLPGSEQAVSPTRVGAGRVHQDGDGLAASVAEFR